MQVDERSFRKALGSFPTGVTVVTGVMPEDGKLVGVTVSAFSSLSLDPALVLFCLDKRTRSLDAFLKGCVAIHILREDQREVSIQFASRMEDKFNAVEYSLNSSGVPLLAGCLARLECSVAEAIDQGDHYIIICQVVNLEYKTGGQPLLYFRGAYACIGDCG